MRIWWLVAVAIVATVTLAVVVAVIGSGDTSILDIEVGDCFDLPLDGDDVDLTTVVVVDCNAPHEAKVVLVGELNPDGDRPYPDDGALFAEIDSRCASVAASAGDGFGMLPIASNEESWEPFAGRFACVAMPYGGGRATGSIGAG